jgi:hypothetical protein
MKVWMLSQFDTAPMINTEWPIASAYSNGHRCPQHPVAPETWALVLCKSNPQQIEAAAQDPRIRTFTTLQDPLPPEALKAYASVLPKTAQPGRLAKWLMRLLGVPVPEVTLGQLIQALAKTEPGFQMDMA